jgi:uncharacterized spore protein YtfJ
MAQSEQDQKGDNSSSKEVEATTDNFTSMVQEVVSQVCSSSSVRNVFGEPVTRDDVTIIPVASIIAGFGAGAGAGRHKEQPQADAGNGNGAGMGVGGGFIMQPWGVWEISKNEVRFRRAARPSLLSTLFEAATSILGRRH